MGLSEAEGQTCKGCNVLLIFFSFSCRVQEVLEEEVKFHVPLWATCHHEGLGCFHKHVYLKQTIHCFWLVTPPPSSFPSRPLSIYSSWSSYDRLTMPPPGLRESTSSWGSCWTRVKSLRRCRNTHNAPQTSSSGQCRHWLETSSFS